MDNQNQPTTQQPSVPAPTTIPSHKPPMLFMILGAIVLIGAGFLGGYLINGNSKTPAVENTTLPTNSVPTYIPKTSPKIFPTETLKSSKPYEQSIGCNGNECLSDSEEPGVVKGFAVLKGYYNQYVASAWGTEKTCDSLLVTGGSEKLITSFKKQIEASNGINRFDGHKNLIVTIDISELEPADKQKLLASTANNPVEIGAIRITTGGTGAPVCFSFLDLLYVR